VEAPRLDHKKQQWLEFREREEIITGWENQPRERESKGGLFNFFGILRKRKSRNSRNLTNERFQNREKRDSFAWTEGTSGKETARQKGGVARRGKRGGTFYDSPAKRREYSIHSLTEGLFTKNVG